MKQKWNIPVNPTEPKDVVYIPRNDQIPPQLVCRCGETIELYYDRTLKSGSLVWWGNCICKAEYYIKLDVQEE